jgi:hypothetical protein
VTYFIVWFSVSAVVADGTRLTRMDEIALGRS